MLASLGVVGIGSGNLFAQATEKAVQTDTAGMEEYVKKGLINAKWGSGQGELGLDEHADMGPKGPSCFTVAPNGDIYIGDRYNNRVVRYNKNGSYIGELHLARGKNEIAVDEDRFIYWVDGGSISKYDWKGNLYIEYQIPEGIWGKVVIEGEKLLIFRAGDNKLWQLGTTNKAFSKELQIKSERTLEFPFTAPPASKHGLFLGNDGNGNVYIEIFPGNESAWVYKYSIKGRTLARVMISPEPSYSSTGMYDVRVDKEGSIYYLFSTKQSFQILKFIKVK